jgi:hypothetical protein
MHKWQYLGLVSVGCLGLSLTACQTRSEGPLTAEETVAESVVCESPGDETGQLTPDEQLLSAIRAYDLAGVEAALAAGADPNAGGIYQGYALQIAASLGDPDIVHLLIESGADVDQSADEGYTALVEAVIEDNLPVAAYLIEAGANVNQVAAGQTPVMIAADAGNPELVQLLLENGADPNLQPGFSIVESARTKQQEVQQSYDQVIDLLTGAGAQ